MSIIYINIFSFYVFQGVQEQADRDVQARTKKPTKVFEMAKRVEERQASNIIQVLKNIFNFTFLLDFSRKNTGDAGN